MEAIDHQHYLDIRGNMRKINKVKLFVNDNLKSRNVAEIVLERLKESEFEIVDDDFDLGVAIGGDGSFLRMIKNSNFNSNCYYVGINAGTLGFAQDVSIDQIEEFINMINMNTFKCEEIGVQEIEITTDDSISRHFSLNEFVVRDSNLSVTSLAVKIEDVLLEEYVGDGILVATSFGSTAYNMSLGGSIVYNTFHTLQITPIAPLNSKAYRNLLVPIIVPQEKIISLIPKVNKRDLIIIIDGDKQSYHNVLKIDTFVSKKTIKILRMSDYNFAKKIGDKFLK